MDLKTFITEAAKLIVTLQQAGHDASPIIEDVIRVSKAGTVTEADWDRQKVSRKQLADRLNAPRRSEV